MEKEPPAEWLEAHFEKTREIPSEAAAVVVGQQPDGRVGVLLLPPVGVSANASPLPLVAAVALRMLEDARAAMGLGEDTVRGGVFYEVTGDGAQSIQTREHLLRDLHPAAQQFAQTSVPGEVLALPQRVIFHMIEENAVYRVGRERKRNQA